MTTGSFLVAPNNFDLQLSTANSTLGGITFPGIDLTVDATGTLPTGANADYENWYDSLVTNSSQYEFHANLTVADLDNDVAQAVTSIYMTWSELQDPSSAKYADEWEVCAIGLDTLYVANAPSLSETESNTAMPCSSVFGSSCFTSLLGSLEIWMNDTQSKVNSTKDLCQTDISFDTPDACSDAFADNEIHFFSIPLSTGDISSGQTLFQRAINGSSSDDIYDSEISVIYPVGTITYHSAASGWNKLPADIMPFGYELMCLQLEAIDYEDEKQSGDLSWDETSSTTPAGYEKLSSAGTKSEPSGAILGVLVMAIIALLSV